MAELNYAVHKLKKRLEDDTDDTADFATKFNFQTQEKEILSASIAHVESTRQLARESDAVQRTIQEMVDKFVDDDDFDIAQLTDEGFEKLMEEHMAPIRPLEDESQFDNALNRLNEKLKKEEERLEELDECSVRVTKYDPISKQQISNPVIDMVCGHVYDKKSIEQAAGKSLTMMCPFEGCPNRIIISELVDYPEYWDKLREE